MEKVETKCIAQTVRLGFMAPLTGIVGLYGAEISMAGRIACDEVNEAGGVLGRQLELLIEDDGSLPPSSVAAAERLIDEHECVAVIGNLLSNSRIAVAYQVAEPRRIPYLNFSFYEGSILSHYFFHFAALPNQQIDRMIPYMRDRFGPRMFFAGNNYEWPRGSIDAAKRTLEQSGGEVVGEEYCPIGVSREAIERLLDQVAASRANVFVPYFAGADQIELLTRFTERGFKEKMAVVMGHYDEVMARILPPEVREGFYSSNTYFMTLDTKENREYLARLSRQPGINGIWPHGNGILTNFGEGAYHCVKAFAQAANQVGSLDAEALIAALQMIAVSGPQGVVKMDPVTHHARVNTYLSRCRSDGAFEIIERFGAIDPVLPERYRHMRIVRQSEPEDIYLHSRMMAQMTEAVLLVRAADGAIVYANPGAGRMFGYSEDELKGKGFPAILAPSGKTVEETVAFIGATLTRKGVWEGETENITGDGRRFWCTSSGSVFTHPSHGEVWMLLNRDITERKRAEAKLKEYQEHLEDLVKERTEELAHSNAQLNTVLANLTEGLIVSDLEGNLLHWNPAAVGMHGFASEEEGKLRLVQFERIFELSTEQDGILPVEEWPLTRILTGEVLRDWEVCIRRLDRDWSRVFNYGGTVARDNDGKPVLAVVTVADITERKLAEEAIQHHSAVLAGINRVLELGLGQQTEKVMLEECLRIVEKATDSRISFIGEIGADDFLHDLAISNPGWKACKMYDQTGHRKPPGNFIIHGIYGRVLHDGKGLIANKPSSHPDRIGLPAGHPPLKSFLGVPLTREGKTVGMIAVGNREGGYRSEDQQALEAITPAITQVIDRKRAEEALRESEARLRATLRSVADEIWIIDTQGSIVSLSDSVMENLGVSSDKWVDIEAALDQLVILRPDGTPRPREDAILSRALRGEVIRNEGEMIRNLATGQLRWREVSGAPIRDAGDRIIGAVTVVRDITERKWAEEALLDSKAKLQAALASMTDAVFISDKEGQFIEFNDAFATFHKFGNKDECARTFAEYPDILDVYMADGTLAPIEMWAVPRALRGETVNNAEYKLRRKDTGETWVGSYSFGPIRDKKGEIIGSVVAGRDITERKRAEDAIKTSLAEKEVMLKEIHHRVKNNLQVISSLVSMQADTLTDERIRVELEDVSDRVRSMALVHEKLYQTNNLAQIDFADYAASMLRALWCSHGALADNIRLHLEVVPVALPIETAIPCGLILNELALNALKYAFPNGGDGEVTVGLQFDSAANTVSLRVRDNGGGLPMGLDWRQSPSLGLRLVQILTGQLRGTVETGTGPGVEFQVTFPLNVQS